MNKVKIFWGGAANKVGRVDWSKAADCKLGIPGSGGGAMNFFE